MFRRCSWFLFVLIFAAYLFNTFARGEEQADGQGDKNAKRKAIQKALTKEVDWNFVNMPLADVADFLQKDLHVRIHLDLKAISDSGITADSSVTFKIGGISAKSALHLMLREIGLTSVIRDEVLLITSPEEAENYLLTRTYDVTDLLLGEDESEGFDYDPLIDMITKTIMPTTWDDVGGPGSVQPFASAGITALVISQTEETHVKVTDLLANLRAMRHPSKKQRKNGPPPPETPAETHAFPALSAAETASRAADKKIRAALEKKINWNFNEKPLAEVVDFLQKDLNIKILLDFKMLADLGIEPDTPVSFALSDISARSALDLMLDKLGITFTVRNEVLLITTPEEANTTLFIRTYDVSDLPAYSMEKGKTIPDYDMFIETIIKTIQPTSWDTVGGPASIQVANSGGIQALVISQTWESQEAIGDLLEGLRKHRKKSLTKEELEKLPPPPKPKPKTNGVGGMGPLGMNGRSIKKLPPLNADAARDAVVQSNNRFSADLYAKLRENNKDNLFFSSYSLSSVLAMAYAGARGETADEMAKTLHFSLKQDEIPQAYQSLLKATIIPERPGCELRVANRLWCQKDYKFRETFLTINRDKFDSEIGQVNFSYPKTVRKLINDWIEENTNHRIKDAIGEGAIHALTRFAITNAIYFKGKWEEPFVKADTKDEPFYADDATRKVPMMSLKHVHHRYAEIGDVQVLEKPYIGGDISMLIVLPEKKPGALAKLEQDFNSEKLKEWIESLKEREVNLYLPRFNMESRYPLNGVLSQLGIRKAFSPKEADFSGIKEEQEPLWIDSIIQATFLQVDEEGTEAAAATFMGGMPPIAPKTIVFCADHPFLFLIRDTRTGCILFMGRVMQPESSTVEKD